MKEEGERDSREGKGEEERIERKKRYKVRGKVEGRGIREGEGGKGEEKLETARGEDREG